MSNTRPRRQSRSSTSSSRSHSYYHGRFSALSFATPFLLLLVLHEEFSHNPHQHGGGSGGGSGSGGVWCHAAEAAATDASSSSSSSSRTRTRNNDIPVQLRLYLIRHGESAANKWGLLAGQEDVPLTDTGVFQARKLGQHVASSSSSWRRRITPVLPTDTNRSSTIVQTTAAPSFFWRMYSSDLVRAVNTATYLMEEANTSSVGEKLPLFDQQELQLDVRLRERSYGARQGMSKTLTEAQALEIWKSHRLEPPPYETDEDLWQRGTEWLMDVVRDLQNELVLTRAETAASAESATAGWKENSVASTVVLPSTEGNEEEGGEELSNAGELGTPPLPPPLVYNVLVTSHAGIIRELVLHLFSLSELQEQGAQFDASRKNRLIIPNTSVTIIEFDLTRTPPSVSAGDQEDCSSTSTTTGMVDRDSLLQSARLVQLAKADHLDHIQVHDD